MRRYLIVIAAVIFLWRAGECAAAPETTEIFGRLSPRVVQVRVLERVSGSKSAIGSGFFVGASGETITNYHVVSQIVFYPERYTIEIVNYQNEVRPARLLYFDAVHDLALLDAEGESREYFAVTAPVIAQGMRLYSFGNPHDLGKSIVEGTYNGFLQDTRYQKIHFTGSINPGMSGGPTVTADGALAGVNVSTAGNQMSFIVPAQFVAELLQESSAQPAVDFLELLRKQLLRDQERIGAELRSANFKPVLLGRYSLPSELTPLFRCWSNRESEDNDRYELVVQRCSTSDSIFVSPLLVAGASIIQHSYFTAKELNRFQFASLLDYSLAPTAGISASREEEVTNYLCRDRLLQQRGVPVRVFFCAREFKKLRGLFDVYLAFITHAEDRAAVFSQLGMTGLSFENGAAVSEKFLEAVEWKP